MYFDENDNNFYYSECAQELDYQDFPLGCPYRQRPPFTSPPQGPHGRPPSVPPSFTPPLPQTQQHGANPLAIDPGAIRPCMFRFVYIWPRRGNGFWAWITFVGPRSLAGFRWIRNTWRYFGMDLRDIRSFQCF
jgi:hypothetical protein